MTQQFKTLLLIAALFVATSLANGPCGPSDYVQPEDCMERALDPAEGNCWWAYETGTCLEVYANDEAQCMDYCVSCLSCVYEFGCCLEGNLDMIQNCYITCTYNLQKGK